MHHNACLGFTFIKQHFVSFASLSFAATTTLALALLLLLLTLLPFLRHVSLYFIFYSVLYLVYYVVIAFSLLWIMPFRLLCSLLTLIICLFTLSNWCYLAFFLSIIACHNIFSLCLLESFLPFLAFCLAFYLVSCFATYHIICIYLAFSLVLHLFANPRFLPCPFSSTFPLCRCISILLCSLLCHLPCCSHPPDQLFKFSCFSLSFSTMSYHYY